MNNYYIIEDDTGEIHSCKTLKKMLKKADKLEKKGRSVTCEICVG
jgi:hypothetical protein